MAQLQKNFQYEFTFIRAKGTTPQSVFSNEPWKNHSPARYESKTRLSYVECFAWACFPIHLLDRALLHQNFCLPDTSVTWGAPLAEIQPLSTPIIHRVCKVQGLTEVMSCQGREYLINRQKENNNIFFQETRGPKHLWGCTFGSWLETSLFYLYPHRKPCCWLLFFLSSWEKK